MILAIILFIVIILLLAILITFTFFILLPSIKTSDNNQDPIVQPRKKDFLIPEDKYYEKTNMRAVVLCSSHKKTFLPKTCFNTEHSCFMAKTAYSTGLDCKFACLGLGDCAKVCPQQAIFVENHTAVISSNCIGCGKCEEVCPQKLIKLIPNDTKSYILCNNTKQEIITSCDKCNCEEKIEWPSKKDFKIWAYCYKIIKRISKK